MATLLEPDRYSRQTLFAPIGKAGQERLRNSSVTIIGCGALGTVLANNLCRAGIGRITIADRDFIEMNNLQRQVLFDEEDVARHLPKAIAAAEKLRRMNSETKVEALVEDVNADGIEALVRETDVPCGRPLLSLESDVVRWCIEAYYADGEAPAGDQG